MHESLHRNYTHSFWSDFCMFTYNLIYTDAERIRTQAHTRISQEAYSQFISGQWRYMVSTSFVALFVLMWWVDNALQMYCTWTNDWICHDLPLSPWAPPVHSEIRVTQPFWVVFLVRRVAVLIMFSKHLSQTVKPWWIQMCLQRRPCLFLLAVQSVHSRECICRWSPPCITVCLWGTTSCYLREQGHGCDCLLDKAFPNRKLAWIEGKTALAQSPWIDFSWFKFNYRCLFGFEKFQSMACLDNDPWNDKERPLIKVPSAYRGADPWALMSYMVVAVNLDMNSIKC